MQQPAFRKKLQNFRRAVRRSRRRAPTDSGRDSRLPRVPVTMPRFSIPPPIPRVIEVTPLKRQLVELTVISADTSTYTEVSQSSIITALTALGISAYSITLHRVLAYQIDQADPGTYGPLQLMDGPSGYTQEFTGVPGVRAPSGMLTYPPQYSLPFLGTSTSTNYLARANFIDRLYVDVSWVTKIGLLTPVSPDITDLDIVEPLSPVPSVASTVSRSLRVRSSKK